MGDKKSEKENRVAKKEFIKEQIKPDVKSIFIKIITRIAQTLAIALFFGAVAGTTIYFVNNVLKIKSPFADDTNYQADTKIEISDSREDATTVPPENVEVSDEDSSTIWNYETIQKKLYNIGEKCNDYIVNVVTTGKSNDWFESDISYGSNTGIVIKKLNDSYYVLALDWDSKEGTKYSISFKDSSAVDAKVISENESMNLAILSVDEDDLSDFERDNIKVAKFQTSQAFDLGTIVVGIGRPNGVLYSVLTGSIVSEGLTSSLVDNELSLYISDIPFSEKGNGVMVNNKGEIVGIINTDNSDITGNSGLACVSMQDMEGIINSMISGKDRPYLGIVGASVTADIMKEEKLSQGVYVTSVENGSPALDGGVRVADVIAKFDGETISSMNDIEKFLDVHEPGDEVKLTVIRGSGKNQKKSSLKITLD
ncbi:MAG: S1C family serine protease [Lachnospiraceae bacterium]|nr:S1C family serine protease [Lachnospiraceae bacterium]